ncbi:MAG: sigma-54 dependent transcriptional regulator [Desulfobacula sp.]|uniref:sigma-54-dependent transcriptional regulator n=1 Tax=Desulfobacula sp. TaxID=2593537 RepID=UPI0025C58104|nr:sigma-54 dependent transcriptional regulator [Desulfobacula sp.]MCD4718918.1 sigma-54 dependent transcriptional regulator [Desulfobacula sp.]
MNKILIVDDDASILKVLKMRLEAGGYDVSMAVSMKEAIQIAKNSIFDLALLDYKLGDGNGVMLMEELKAIMPQIQVIILTAFGTIGNAVDAMKKGAFTYLTKPFDDAELMHQVKNCLEKSSLSREVENLRSMVSNQLGFENIICKSDSMINTLKLVKQAAVTDSTVLISGESGTGKELVAKSVHLASSRRKNSFVAVNCAALPENLFESELFGYEKGAFTGAAKRKAGFLSQAQEGTFFFDEVSEIPLTMQVKLLRVLQENEFYPLGSNKTIELDTRIIAATNKDLALEVSKGKFRQDLFYRIHVIPINIPPLRERLDCIPHLVDYFIREYAKTMQKEIKKISDVGMNKIFQYAWPGNVRELKNVIEYAVAMSDSKVISEDLILQKPDGVRRNEVLKPLKKAKKDFEKEYIKKLLRLTKGNVSQASKFAGKYRSDFYELMKKYSLEINEFRS